MDSKPQKGSAIILVLWAVAVTSLTVLGAARYMGATMDEEALRARDFRARQLAESGIAVALHPSVERYDPVLTRSMRPGESFKVKLSSEGGRLNINALLAKNQRRVLRRLFMEWGVEQDEAAKALNCLSDWVDGNDLTRLNGAEQEEYEAMGRSSLPPNTYFSSVEEMRLVIGMDVVEKAKPDFTRFFTVHSSGMLDLNEASAELIQMVCDISQEQAQSFVDQRDGLDGEHGTEDDVVYTSMDSARLALGIDAGRFKNLSQILTLKDPITRIESTGKVGKYERTLVLITERKQGKISQTTWLTY